MFDASIESDMCSVVATATLSNDGLYYIDSLQKFLTYNESSMRNCVPCSQLYYSSKETSTTSVEKHTHELMNTLSDKQFTRGSSHLQPRAFSYGLNPLEVLHVKNGHASESVIKWALKHKTSVGMGYTYADVKDLTLPPCAACLEGKMRAFPSPPSLTLRVYAPFEYISGDILIWNRTSVRGFRFTVLYIDKGTSMLFNYHMKTKSEILRTFQDLIRDHGQSKNPKAVKLRIFNTDSASEVLSEEFKAFVRDNDITLFLSAPYKHEQNMIESLVTSVKGNLRTTLAYNKCPLFYYCYAFDHMIHTTVRLPKIGALESRIEAFTGSKPDVSYFVPFYSSGHFHVTADERLTLGAGKPFHMRGRRCRMLGYPHTPLIQTKNSYICLTHGTSNNILIRHDCHFNHFTDDFPSLLSAEVEKRNPATFIPELMPDYTPLMGNVERNDDDVVPTEVLPDDVDITQKSDDSPLLLNQQSDTIQHAFEQSLANSMETDAPDCTLPTTIDEEVELDHLPAFTRQTRSSTHPTAPVFNHKTLRYAYAASSDEGTLYETINFEVKPKVEDVGTAEPAINFNDIPKSMTDVERRSDRSKWEEAYDTEMSRIQSRLTYEVCSDKDQDDPTLIAIKSKYAFRLTRRPDGTLKYKVRLVACGYSQVFGRDYEDTYAPTASFKSFCTIMQLAALDDWVVKGIDVENAYLEAPIDKEIFMYLPQERFKRENNKPVKVKLLKSLYGLKQAGELWFQLLRQELIKLGYTQCLHDVCVYKKIDPETGAKAYILVYVDDIIFTGSNATAVDNDIDQLGSSFTKITELGEITRYIGIDIERDRDNHSISISQIPYIEQYLNEVTDATMTSKPMPFNPLLDYNCKGDDLNTLPSIRPEIGKLRFMADRTRPELSWYVGKLATASENPSENHMKGLKHLNRYLLGSSSEKLTFGGADKEIKLFGFSDASYISKSDSKSQLAYCFFLNKTSGTVSARSKKDTTVSHSSAEAEIKALDLAILQATWFRGFLSEIGYPQLEPTVIFTDSISAKTLADTFHISSNSGHMVVRINYIHQEILAGNISLQYIDTNNMVADVLTKALPAKPLIAHRKKLLRGFDNTTPTPIRRRSLVGAKPKRKKVKRGGSA
jgi:transposase InsO family protein